MIGRICLIGTAKVMSTNDWRGRKRIIAKS